MSFRTRSELEEEVLDEFVDNMEGSEVISEDVREIIIDSMRRTTLSQTSDAEEIGGILLEEAENATD